MSRKKGAVKGFTKEYDQKRGRQEIPIDWDKVDYMLEAGCLGTEIAAEIGVSRHTLYNKCVEEKGILFSDYSRSKKEKGDGRLRLLQYNLCKQLDRAMLIWLGKQRLQQREKPESNQEFNGKLSELLDLLKEKNMQGRDCKKEDY